MEKPEITFKESLLLHWVMKIRDLNSVQNTLQTQLNLKVLRHEEFNSACEASCNGNFKNAWSKTMVGLGDELSHFALELVYNYSKNEDYQRHTGFLNLEFFEKNNLNKERNSNYSLFTVENYTIAKFNTNYCKDYLKILTDDFTENDFKNDFKFLTLEVNDLQKSVCYYEEILNMKVFSKERNLNTENYKERLSEEYLENNKCNFCVLGYEKNQTLLKLVQCQENVKVHQGEDSGRMAFACNGDVFDIREHIEIKNEKVLHQPVVLKTEGKADVKVIILQDKDDYEICFVERKGFEGLSKFYEGADFIDWKMRGLIKNKIQS